MSQNKTLQRKSLEPAPHIHEFCVLRFTQAWTSQHYMKKRRLADEVAPMCTLRPSGH